LAGASRLLGMNPPPPTDRPSNSIPLPVITPDVKDLPFAVDNGVKLFRLTAEPVKRKIALWKPVIAGASTVRVPALRSRSIRAKVRILLEDHLPESTAIHWQWLEIPYAMDWMPYLSQKPIAPGSQFAYGEDARGIPRNEVRSDT
jgi:manganese oxidase